MKEKKQTEEISQEILEGEVEDIIEESVDDQGEVIDETQKKIDTLEQQVHESFDKYQRTLAEFDNFRKRTAKEKATLYDDGIRNTIEKLLMVVDNLERAVATQVAKEQEEDGFFKGVEMTLKQFQDVMKSMEVEVIAAVGEKFDPNLHAAVAHEDDENFGENEIILEMLKGYQYKGKVIRHSMVKVAN